ncbi:MAG: hypothetical protein GY696_33750 [Gammaproteobacteria bacterium]|nr:hypothetical protein [Gammaproteobacteria bacterium]
MHLKVTKLFAVFIGSERLVFLAPNHCWLVSSRSPTLSLGNTAEQGDGAAMQRLSAGAADANASSNASLVCKYQSGWLLRFQVWGILSAF